MADQLQGQYVGPGDQTYDMRCITFLAPRMDPHDNRFRDPGQLSITIHEYEALAPVGQMTRVRPDGTIDRMRPARDAG